MFIFFFLIIFYLIIIIKKGWRRAFWSKVQTDERLKRRLNLIRQIKYLRILGVSPFFKRQQLSLTFNVPLNLLCVWIWLAIS